ncbi:MULTISPECIES: TldD/PmbA family protein [unclassified Oceanispirochaeta]|uniref:TldD/PmbA family protein n=1 Tax=unclassified Oceanispirochaeta TaxID=2635722 RepID=UPI000E0980B4|nr:MULTISPECIES: TldD/PmbA family protein [unclassified Oceanispirochaeta]MBF9014673.1 TldD/PmbA family protein [Oceanispirochaeta sp. M2]NPD70929.1 TldD/PmbA family protein [Oceanispirochaeta sp. M1]RDG33763.1 TldD/PmbA family protein [Oceanispirochaeta sp. M1]
MNVQISSFLQDHRVKLKELVSLLSKEFKYISILGCDSSGTRYQMMKTGSSINESSWAERGFVCRIYNGRGYSEYSFSQLKDIEETAAAIRQSAEEAVILSKSLNQVEYPLIEEEKWSESFRGTVKNSPVQTGSETIINQLKARMDEGLKMADFLVDLRVIYEYVHISKIFISSNKDLDQSYIWSQGYMFPIGKNEKGIKYTHKSFSGMKGTELLDEMQDALKDAIDEVEDLLNSERLVPGEYDIICNPAMSGLIAHEAFGHGVEMDMFVKKRAMAADYMNKAVASEKVNMHDGAAAADQVSSYLFDDEGMGGANSKIIDKGVLKMGISDLLSALKLGTKPTGNGKRQSFERKTYTRMTNTFFSPGTDSLDDMISSIDRGYLLENFSSGMEDPKNWGIQCVAVKGREIVNGKLTGRIVSPVFLTGFVPDLLKSISMVSPDLELSGSGACGKGYKEFVKTSTGGPYLKTKGKLA